MADQDRILIGTFAFHLGDNPGLFSGHAFVGHSVTLPLHAGWIADTGDATFVLRTHDVETWDDSWQGHLVELVSADGTKVRSLGRIKDKDDAQPESEEVSEMRLPIRELANIAGEQKNFYLRVTLGVQPALPGMADDFGLTRIECVNATLRLGWSR